MVDLNAIAVFVKVVEVGSFIGAARALDLPKTNVSRLMAQLETDLGTKLLHRTTRRMSLTEVGVLYFERCQQILGDLAAANTAVTQLQAVPHGRIRMTAPILFGQRVLYPWLVTFLQRYPQVTVDVHLSNQYRDVIADQIDVAFRAGEVGDSSLTAQSLGQIPYWVCASLAYLSTHGYPTTPYDLTHHTCIGLDASARKWIFFAEMEEITIPVTTRLKTNDLELAKQAAIADLGIAYVPALLVDEAVQQGQLVRLLPAWKTIERDLFMVYSSSRPLSAKVQAFVDFVLAQPHPLASWHGSQESPSKI